MCIKKKKKKKSTYDHYEFVQANGLLTNEFSYFWKMSITIHKWQHLYINP